MTQTFFGILRMDEKVDVGAGCVVCALQFVPCSHVLNGSFQQYSIMSPGTLQHATFDCKHSPQAMPQYAAPCRALRQTNLIIRRRCACALAPTLTHTVCVLCRG